MNDGFELRSGTSAPGITYSGKRPDIFIATNEKLGTTDPRIPANFSIPL